MRGHEKIIEMRMRGFTPKWVFVNDFDCKTDWFTNNDHATVCVLGDPVGRLDLRFLNDLHVSVCSTSEIRARALFAAARLTGARVVAGCHQKPEKQFWEQDGWTEIWRRPDVAVVAELEAA